MFGLALEDHGREAVLKKVGVEPTGEAFNAIVLDEKSNRPFNPLVNAGAIATADLIEGKDFADRIKRLMGMFSRYTGRDALRRQRHFHVRAHNGPPQSGDRPSDAQLRHGQRAD